MKTLMTKKLMALTLAGSLLLGGSISFAADNITVTQGSGTTMATDDVGGAHYQRVKAVWGADGAVNDTSAAAPMPVTLNAAEKAEDAANAGGEKGVPILSTRRDSDAATAGTDGDYAELQTDASGFLKVNVKAALPAGTNAIGKLAANSGVDIGDVDITSVIPGVGATNLGKAEDAAHTTADTGVPMFAVVETTTGGTSATDGDYAIPTLNADGALRVQVVPNTTGGKTAFRSIDVDESEDEIKASAGVLYSMTIQNDTAGTKLYVKVYNETAANVSVGTTTPVFTYVLAGGERQQVDFGDSGVNFSAGICVAATTGLADADTGAPAGNAIIVNASYK